MLLCSFEYTMSYIIINIYIYIYIHVYIICTCMFSLYVVKISFLGTFFSKFD